MHDNEERKTDCGGSNDGRVDVNDGIDAPLEKLNVVLTNWLNVTRIVL